MGDRAMRRAKAIRSLVVLLFWVTTGCGDHEQGLPTARALKVRPVVDGGWIDGGVIEDAALADAGVKIDAGDDAAAPIDSTDAATPIDAPPTDASAPDGSVADASVADGQWIDADTIAVATVRAGDVLSVTCLLENAAHQRIVASETISSTVTATPTSAAIWREDGTLVPTRSGELAVGCSFPALGLVDATPVNVRVLPGVAAKTVASLDRNSMVAGQTVTVSCGVFDAFDNPIVEYTPTIRFYPFEVRNTVLARQGTFERAGSFEVHCDLGGTTSIPAKLDVVPALPASLVVAPAPVRETYTPGELIELTRKVADRFGNPVLTATVPVVSEPGGVEVGDGSFYYTKSGTYRLTATVTPPTDGGTVLAKSVEVVVDGTGPTIRCDYPLDAEVLNLSPGGKVVFRGTVTDPSGINELRVNDIVRTVDASGHFTAELASHFGIHFVDLVSNDNAGRQTKRVCAFLMANHWVPDASFIDDTFSFWLRQPAVDDGTRSDLDSLADILQAVLASGQLRDAVHAALSKNSALKSGCDQVVQGQCLLRSQVNYLDTRIAGPNSNSLRLADDGLRSTTQIANLAVELRVDGELAGLSYQNQGWVNFESIEVTTTFDLTKSGGRPRVTVRPGSTATSVGRITAEFAGTEGEVLALIVELANGILREYVAMRVQALVTENLNAILDGILGSFDPSALGSNTSVARLDGTGAIPLQVALQFSSLATNSTRMLFGMGASFDAPALTTKPSTGTPLAQTVQALLPETEEPIGVATHEALLGQGLYTLWRAGYFDVTLNDTSKVLALPLGMSVSLVTQLPPVAQLRGTRVEVSLGGVVARLRHTTMFPLPIPMALGARASMAIHHQGNQLTFDDFTLDETHLSVDAPELDATLRGLLEGAIPGMLKLVVGDALRNALPAFGVPAFTLPPAAAAFGLPAGARFGMEVSGLTVEPPRVILLGQAALF